MRTRSLSVLARLRDRLVSLLRGRPRMAERVLVLPRLVPGRSTRAKLYRSFSWPLVDHLRPRVEISSRGGKMVVDTGDLVGRVLAASGVWEPHVTEAFRGRLSAGDVCVDVGAHIGYYTLLASKLVGPRGWVYALEASPGIYRALEANIARNGATNVTAFNLAAGAANGHAVLYEAPGGGSGNSSLSPRVLDLPPAGVAVDYRPVEVKVAAVDTLVPHEAFGRVRMIKIDVEGYEVEVLRGLEGVLAEGDPVAVILELSPQWSLEDPAPFVEELCRRHRLDAFRLVNDYSLDGYFPTRIEPPARIDEIPAERCDLLLVRGA